MEIIYFSQPEINYPPTIEDIDNIQNFITILETAFSNGADVLEQLVNYGNELAQLSMELAEGTKSFKYEYREESARIQVLSNLALDAVIEA